MSNLKRKRIHVGNEADHQGRDQAAIVEFVARTPEFSAQVWKLVARGAAARIAPYVGVADNWLTSPGVALAGVDIARIEGRGIGPLARAQDLPTLRSYPYFIHFTLHFTD